MLRGRFWEVDGPNEKLGVWIAYCRMRVTLAARREPIRMAVFLRDIDYPYGALCEVGPPFFGGGLRLGLAPGYGPQRGLRSVLSAYSDCFCGVMETAKNQLRSERGA